MKCEPVTSVGREFLEEEEQVWREAAQHGLVWGLWGDGAGGGGAAGSRQVWEALMALYLLALGSLQRALVGTR